jgi:predicted GIY-YIG superfamily endonuclease
MVKLLESNDLQEGKNGPNEGCYHNTPAALTVNRPGILKADVAGVYFLYETGECVYIGQTNNIWYRIGQHLKGHRWSGALAPNGIHFDSWEYREIKDDDLRLREEYRLIRELKPRYNKQWR